MKSIADALYSSAWAGRLRLLLPSKPVRLLEAVENVGLEALHAPHIKHLDGKLWELRVRAEGGIARHRGGRSRPPGSV